MTKQLWTIIVACITNLVVYFGSKYFDPSIAEDIKFVLDTANALVAVLLLHFYGQDVKAFVQAALYRISK